MKRALLTALATIVFAAGITGTPSAAAETGKWKKNATGYWYEFPDGTHPSDQWQKISGKWYYFKSNGYMATGWQKIDGKWYYFSMASKTLGEMQTGWQYIDNNWYFFKSGVMQTGWKQLSGKWYYFKNGAMSTGWKKISSKWYYFLHNGNMVKGSVWKIKNMLYEFNTSGVCTTLSGKAVDENLEWFEEKLIKEAYDEVIKEAWDEKVLVKEAWTEQVPSYSWVIYETSPRTGKTVAIGCSENTPGAECIFTGYRTVDHDAEYKTVHHKAETVHHNAEYKTVHHDAVTHTETYCKTCGATK